MAISINWTNKVILVPKTDLTYLSGSSYELDVNWLRLSLKGIEDGTEGIVFLDTHRHNTELTLSGVTYARAVEIINGYTVEFEDGQYTVVCVGANHNLADVKVANQVSLIIGNSAGLIAVSTGAGPDLTNEVMTIMRLLRNKMVSDPNTGQATLYADDDVTPLYVAPIFEDVAGTQPYRARGSDRRDRFQ
jgi:hypothetical protein